MNLDLLNKFALITGGTHGIGRAIALSLATEGVNVAVCGRDQKKLTSTIKELQKKKVKVIGIKADVMNETDIERVINKVISAWGTVHILINNVGGGGRWGLKKVEKTDESIWIEVYKKNSLSTVKFTMMVIPYMKKQKWGRVITITSIHGVEAGGRPWFSMAKSAQTTLMKTLSRDPRFVRSGITFNSVAPGGIMIPDTGWALEMEKNQTKFKKLIDKDFPLGRLGNPKEVAYIVTCICSPKASLLNGASIKVDGGQSLSF